MDVTHNLVMIYKLEDSKRRSISGKRKSIGLIMDLCGYEVMNRLRENIDQFIFERGEGGAPNVRKKKVFSVRWMPMAFYISFPGLSVIKKGVYS
ncbi:MAG: hypothetical protein ACFFB5_12435 [Promethearchaeota archaeon]